MSDQLIETYGALNIRPELPPDFPVIVCLCGSTRFSEAFAEVRLQEARAGRIVLSIGCDTKSDTQLLKEGKIVPGDIARFGTLHLRQIDLADEILVLNVGGYVGESTAKEIEHARQCGKRIRWLES